MSYESAELLERGVFPQNSSTYAQNKGRAIHSEQNRPIFGRGAIDLAGPDEIPGPARIEFGLN
ncbi:hypothetical protein Sinac_5641 [Singulisphaera acidiphila DSM 18658]|uniref:Uncharacterized protein n=1 Tax=Singulisphaera acidiphila (strain ATCC BAA-1392 / DSM 18658 / VKM B-2454 / MOB10) TaxID=886293 RepID=L0DLQ5_SINAD|nr:hypothetical protein Sinac_5641 [Singulisphaera acidiphila DSM 18658]